MPLEEIAQQIGDYNNTVERQHHGLMVIEQAERAKVFDRTNVMRKRGFEFSHIYEGLSREGIQKFLGLTRNSRTKQDPVSPSKIGCLGELLEWLYGNNAKNIEPRMRTQAKDLEILSSVLLTKEGVQALRNGLSLELARDASLGDSQLLKQALSRCKAALQDSVGLLSTGFDASDEHPFSVAQDIELLASDLVDSMQAKRRKKKKRSQESGADA